MKIKKYWQFITEADEDEEGFEDIEPSDEEEPTDELGEDDMEEEGDYVSNENPESYIESKLTNIKSKIEKMFPEEPKDTGEVTTSSPDLDKKIKETEPGMTFDDLGMRLEDIEMSDMTKTHQNLTVKFSDENHYYTLLFRIDLKQVTDIEEGEEINLDDIKRCFVKFKKYKIDGFELLGDTSKMIEIDEISEDFLIDLKIELDEKLGGEGEDEFTIEYE